MQQPTRCSFLLDRFLPSRDGQLTRVESGSWQGFVVRPGNCGFLSVDGGWRGGGG